MTVLNTIFWVGLNIGLAFLVRAFPKRHFDPGLPFFREHAFEKPLYRALRVSRWKDRLPEKGNMVGFSKRSMASLDPDYIGLFVTETCIGEVVHLLTGALGYLSVLFALLLEDPRICALALSGVATVNLLIQMLFVVIQRYNRPRLIKLMKMTEKRRPR